MLKDLGVDLSKNTKIDNAVLEVRVDASAGPGIAAGAGRIRRVASPTLRVQTLTQDVIVKMTQILGVSNRAHLGTKHLDGGSVRRALERCHCYIREGSAGSRCEQKCQKSRDPILEFSLLTMLAKLTSVKNGSGVGNSIDHESSDAVKRKQLRDQIV